VCLEVSAPNSPIHNSDMDVDREQKLWEAILAQHELSMNAGSSPSWLTYGWQYRDSEQPIQYGEGEKRPHVKTAANLLKARQILALIESGLSMKKAAAALGIPQSSAVRIIQKYRANSTLSTNSTPIEGNEL
jgi:hypothetical protein